MVKKALIVLADGFEEIEAMAPFDILKRAGVKVTFAGLSGREIKSAQGARIIVGNTLDEAPGEFDALILPGGGKGAENLSASKNLRALIKEMFESGKLVAAICASPAVVLAPTGILSGKKMTCYPSLKNRLPGDVTFLDEAVVTDGNIVTSMGPGTAVLFGLRLAAILAGKDKAKSLEKAMLLDRG